MKCPQCNLGATCTSTKTRDNVTTRLYFCRNCRKVFSTIEEIWKLGGAKEDAVSVQKRD